jgi:hypothetical protein
MIRWIFILLIAVGLAGAAAWYFDLWPPGIEPGPPSVADGEKPEPRVYLGAPLYKPEALKPLPRPDKMPRQVVIDPCHLVTRYKQDISSTKDGKVFFVGEPVPTTGDVMVVGGARVAAALVTRPDQVVPNARKFHTAFLTQGEDKVPQVYREWQEGNVVEKNDMVAMMDPALALNEVLGKEAKVVAAKADYEASVAILNESQARVERLDRIRATSPSAVPLEEYSAAVLTRDKYKFETVSKKEAIKNAAIEKEQADIILEQHELRNAASGKSIVKQIPKQGNAGVHALETIVQLQNLTHLRLEGSIDSKDLSVLKQGMRCLIEPSVDMRPSSEPIQAQVTRINGISVCADGKHFVSGSEDKSIAIWERGLTTPLALVKHPAPVRVVACTPPASGKCWVAVGCGDGAVYVYDVSDPNEPKLVKGLTGQHRGGVSALAFSPDGTYFASGGEDNSIVLWRTADGEVVYPFDAEHGVSSEDAHQGTVTALHFTPQAKLISAGRDNTLRVWGLYEKGARLDYEPIPHRSGTVSQLGVSQDGRYMLFEQGKSLRLLRVADGRTAAVLENLAGAATFEALALFSPDGSLMLTGGAEEGRLQLWNTPEPGGRGFQVRELVTTDRAMITCAAFAPAGAGFAVTGSKEGFVHVWTLPTAAEVQAHRISVDGSGAPLRVDLIEHAVDGSKTRIAVNLVNPHDRLMPGQRATLVVIAE